MGMGKQVNNLIGKKFYRLTVLERAGSDKHGNARWLCVCDCGNKKVITGLDLRQGKVKSCGCYCKEFCQGINYKHGLRNTRVYSIWSGIKDRCFNKDNPAYKHYGGRGISICKEWLDVQNFYDWAMSNGYREDLSIERIDFNSDYCPSNCKWIEKREQPKNTRRNNFITFNGETKTISEWSRSLGGCHSLVRSRLKNGWSLEKALTTPVRSH